jgi:hypothetical protein
VIFAQPMRDHRVFSIVFHQIQFSPLFRESCRSFALARRKLSSSRRYFSYWPFDSDDESDLRPLPPRHTVTASNSPNRTPTRNRASSARIRREHRSDWDLESGNYQRDSAFGSTNRVAESSSSSLHPHSHHHHSHRRRRLPRILDWEIAVVPAPQAPIQIQGRRVERIF